MDEEESYRILIVDDEKEVLSLLQMTLENAKRFNSTVKTAEDGETALNMMKEESFDLIISDHKMEPMNGVELLCRIKDEYPDVIRILITGYSELDLAKEAINRARVYSYLEKPWTNEEIRNTVYDALKEGEKEEGEEEKEEEEPIDEIKLEEGGSYLFKEKKNVKTFNIALDRMRQMDEGLIFSREHPKKFKKNFSIGEGINYLWVTKIAGKDNIDPVNLELIADTIIRYFENGGKTVLLGGIDALLRDNSFNRFVSFLDNIIDIAGVEDGVLILNLDPNIISDKELAALERKMNYVSLD